MHVFPSDATTDGSSNAPTLAHRARRMLHWPAALALLLVMIAWSPPSQAAPQTPPEGGHDLVAEWTGTDAAVRVVAGDLDDGDGRQHTGAAQVAASARDAPLLGHLLEQRLQSDLVIALDIEGAGDLALAHLTLGGLEEGGDLGLRRQSRALGLLVGFLRLLGHVASPGRA